MTDDDIFDRLCGLLPAQFDAVLLRAEAPADFVSSAVAPQATRAGELIRWMQQAPAHDARVRRAVAKALSVPESAADGDGAHDTDDDRLDALYQQLREADSASDKARVRALNQEIRRVKLEKRAGGQLGKDDLLGAEDQGRAGVRPGGLRRRDAAAPRADQRGLLDRPARGHERALWALPRRGRCGAGRMAPPALQRAAAAGGGRELRGRACVLRVGHEASGTHG